MGFMLKPLCDCVFRAAILESSTKQSLLQPGHARLHLTRIFSQAHRRAEHLWNPQCAVPFLWGALSGCNMIFAYFTGVRRGRCSRKSKNSRDLPYFFTGRMNSFTHFLRFLVRENHQIPNLADRHTIWIPLTLTHYYSTLYGCCQRCLLQAADLQHLRYMHDIKAFAATFRSGGKTAWICSRMMI